MPGVPANLKANPQPNRIYAGPVVPTAYDQNWQYYTNLTPAQIAWFQAQPEWGDFKAYVALSPKTATVATPVAVVNSTLAVSAGNTALTAQFIPPKL